MDIQEIGYRLLEVFGIQTVRYFFLSGLAFVVLYVAFKNFFSRYKIQPKFPESLHYKREIFYSVVSIFIFSLTIVGVIVMQKGGYTLIYTDIHEYSTLYFVFSVLVFIVAHDTYFYWTHRLMHHKKIYPHVHLIHHKSYNPSPWAAFAFHPSEAVVQAAIVPLMVLVMPLHPLAILAWGIYQQILNVGGHLGFEFFRSGFTQRFYTKWHNTSTHHNMHHKYVNCNYGLYFNIWDMLMGTNHPKYQEEFEKAVSRRKEETTPAA